jgi:hypothetical protein
MTYFFWLFKIKLSLSQVAKYGQKQNRPQQKQNQYQA